MAWLWLVIAGLFEIGWPLGFKLASLHARYFAVFIALSVLSMALSGYFLYILLFLTLILIGIVGLKLVH